MQTTMSIEICGAEQGSFANQETGELVRYGALYVAQPFPADRGVGMRTSRIKCAPEVVDSIRKIKLPATVQARIDLRESKQGHSIRVTGIETGGSQ